MSQVNTIKLNFLCIQRKLKSLLFSKDSINTMSALQVYEHFIIGDILSFEYKQKQYEVEIESIKGVVVNVRNIKTRIRSSLMLYHLETYFLLPNDDKIYDVKVIQTTPFAFDELPIYLKLKILLYVEHKTFMNLSKVNKELHTFLSGKTIDEFKELHGNLDERFYQERSEYWLNGNILPFRLEENLSWREFYHRAMMVAKSLNYQCKLTEYTKLGRLLELKIIDTKTNLFTDTKKFSYTEFLRNCINNGHVNILEWLSSKGIEPLAHDIEHAIVNNHINVCKFFAEKNLLPLFWKSNLLYKSIEMLKWLISKDYTCSSNDSYQAVIDGKLDIVKFLVERKIYPPFAAVNVAIQNGNLDIVQYFYDNEWIFSHSGAMQNTTKLTSLLEINAILAAQHGHLHILKFFETKGFQMNIVFLDMVIDEWKRDHINILEYCYTKNVFPSKNGIIFLIFRNLLKSIKWLHQHDVQMKKEYCNLAREHGHFGMASWLESVVN